MGKKETQRVEAAMSYAANSAAPLRLGGKHPNCVRVVAETTRGRKREFVVCTTGADAPAMLVSAKSDSKLVQTHSNDQVTVHYAKDKPWPRDLGRRRKR
jgi:hypothetical protein